MTIRFGLLGAGRIGKVHAKAITGNAGATLVALTPELPEFAADTTKKGKIAFEVLSDVGNNVARTYGIVFKMSPEVAEAMRKNAKTAERNGDQSDELPLAAVYVIAPDGKITYSFLDADYKHRAEPSRLVDAVKAQTGGTSALKKPKAGAP